jgi:5-methylcytosine-specific restriction endonuclease McrA
MIARYVNPWKYKREQEELQRVHALRQRDGDDCRRCRRTMRFDLPPGHDWGAKIEEIAPAGTDQSQTLDNLVLCHRRCNAEAADKTREVQERVRRKNEAALFSKTRSRRGKAA